jgi:hypothetical protein
LESKEDRSSPHERLKVGVELFGEMGADMPEQIALPTHPLHKRLGRHRDGWYSRWLLCCRRSVGGNSVG